MQSQLMDSNEVCGKILMEAQTRGQKKHRQAAPNSAGGRKSMRPIQETVAMEEKEGRLGMMLFAAAEPAM